MNLRNPGKWNDVAGRLLAAALSWLVAWNIALPVVWGTSAGEAASAVALATPVSRLPLVIVGGVLTLAGLAGARIMQPWYDLTSLMQRIARVVGVAIGAVGMFLFAVAVSEAPPVPTLAKLPWYQDYAPARARAQELSLPLMVDFTAVWCGACQELEAEVFYAPDIQVRLREEVVLLKVDFDRETIENERLRKQAQVSGLPAVAFFAPDGSHLAEASFEGKLSREEFAARLDRVAAILAHVGAAPGQAVDAPSSVETRLREGGILAALALVFLAGVGSSLTPCVYPLIPITISIFGARQAISKWQGFRLSLTYVLGIAITYALLGVGAAVFGKVFGSLMQNQLVLVSLAGIFVLLGLSSLGVFHFRVPAVLQTRLGQTGGSGYLGALVMGLVAGIIAAPCVGPILAGVLVYVAKQEDISTGVALLVTFAFGMGLLFLVLGTFSSLIHRLPRSGGWMDGVKAVFGVVFIAMALYYLRMGFEPLRAWTRSIWLWLA